MMGIQYHGFLKADWWKPARWWCPDRCYLRFIITISVPRRWWPAKYDGIRMCPYCKERKCRTDCSKAESGQSHLPVFRRPGKSCVSGQQETPEILRCLFQRRLSDWRCHSRATRRDRIRAENRQGQSTGARYPTHLKKAPLLGIIRTKEG